MMIRRVGWLVVFAVAAGTFGISYAAVAVPVTGVAPFRVLEPAIYGVASGEPRVKPGQKNLIAEVKVVNDMRADVKALWMLEIMDPTGKVIAIRYADGDDIRVKRNISRKSSKLWRPQFDLPANLADGTYTAIVKILSPDGKRVYAQAKNEAFMVVGTASPPAGSANEGVMIEGPAGQYFGKFIAGNLTVPLTLEADIMLPGPTCNATLVLAKSAQCNGPQDQFKDFDQIGLLLNPAGSENPSTLYGPRVAEKLVAVADQIATGNWFHARLQIGEDGAVTAHAAGKTFSGKIDPARLKGAWNAHLVANNWTDKPRFRRASVQGTPVSDITMMQTIKNKDTSPSGELAVPAGIRGRVTNQATGPVAGAVVTIHYPDGPNTLHRDATTDASGEYFIQTHDGRYYDFTVNKDGYITHSQKLDFPSGGNITQNIELKSSKIGSPPPSFFIGANSGGAKIVKPDHLRVNINNINFSLQDNRNANIEFDWDAKGDYENTYLGVAIESERGPRKYIGNCMTNVNMTNSSALSGRGSFSLPISDLPDGTVITIWAVSMKYPVGAGSPAQMIENRQEMGTGGFGRVTIGVANGTAIPGWALVLDQASGGSGGPIVIGNTISIVKETPDLELTGIDLEPVEPRPGDLVRILVHGRNAGRSPITTDFIVNFIVDGQSILRTRNGEHSTAANPIWAGTPFSISNQPSSDASALWRATVGTHTIKVVADKLADEIITDNNVKSISVTVPEMEIKLMSMPDNQQDRVKEWDGSVAAVIQLRHAEIVDKGQYYACSIEWGLTNTHATEYLGRTWNVWMTLDGEQFATLSSDIAKSNMSVGSAGTTGFFNFNLAKSLLKPNSTLFLNTNNNAAMAVNWTARVIAAKTELAPVVPGGSITPPPPTSPPYDLVIGENHIPPSQSSNFDIGFKIENRGSNEVKRIACHITLSDALTGATVNEAGDANGFDALILPGKFVTSPFVSGRIPGEMGTSPDPKEYIVRIWAKSPGNMNDIDPENNAKELKIRVTADRKVTVLSEQGGGPSIKPVLTINLESLEFKGVLEAKKFINLKNTGFGTLEGFVTPKASWVKVNPQAFKSNDQGVEISVNAVGVAPGTVMTTEIEITTNGGNKIIPLTTTAFAPQVQLLTPEEGSTVKPEKVAFTWSKLSEANGSRRYRVNVRDKDGSIIEQKDITEGAIAVWSPDVALFSKRPSGKYSWTVVVIDKAGAEDASTSSASRLFLLDNSVSQVKLQSPAEGSKADPGLLSFSWEKLPTGGPLVPLRYRVSIFDGADKEVAAQNIGSGDPAIWVPGEAALASVPDGTYRWSVAAVDQKEVVVEASRSEARSFTLARVTALSGRVRSPDNSKGYSNVIVELLSAEAVVDKQATDANGGFRFEGPKLKPGAYKLRVNDPNLERMTIDATAVEGQEVRKEFALTWIRVENDVALLAITVKPQSQGSSDNLTLSIGVGNIGHIPARGVKLRCFINHKELGGGDIFDLAVGKSDTRVINFSAPSGPTMDIRAELDFAADENGTNDVMRRWIGNEISISTVAGFPVQVLGSRPNPAGISVDIVLYVPGVGATIFPKGLRLSDISLDANGGLVGRELTVPLPEDVDKYFTYNGFGMSCEKIILREGLLTLKDVQLSGGLPLKHNQDFKIAVKGSIVIVPPREGKPNGEVRIDDGGFCIGDFELPGINVKKICAGFQENNSLALDGEATLVAAGNAAVKCNLLMTPPGNVTRFGLGIKNKGLKIPLGPVMFTNPEGEFQIDFATGSATFGGGGDLVPTAPGLENLVRLNINGTLNTTFGKELEITDGRLIGALWVGLNLPPFPRMDINLASAGINFDNTSPGNLIISGQAVAGKLPVFDDQTHTFKEGEGTLAKFELTKDYFRLECGRPPLLPGVIVLGINPDPLPPEFRRILIEPTRTNGEYLVTLMTTDNEGLMALDCVTDNLNDFLPNLLRADCYWKDFQPSENVKSHEAKWTIHNVNPNDRYRIDATVWDINGRIVRKTLFEGRLTNTNVVFQTAPDSAGADKNPLPNLPPSIASISPARMNMVTGGEIKYSLADVSATVKGQNLRAGVKARLEVEGWNHPLEVTLGKSFEGKGESTRDAYPFEWHATGNTEIVSSTEAKINFATWGFDWQEPIFATPVRLKGKWVVLDAKGDKLGECPVEINYLPYSDDILSGEWE